MFNFVHSAVAPSIFTGAHAPTNNLLELTFEPAPGIPFLPPIVGCQDLFAPRPVAPVFVVASCPGFSMTRALFSGSYLLIATRLIADSR